MTNLKNADTGKTTKTFKNPPSTRSRFNIFKYLSAFALVMLLGVNGVKGQVYQEDFGTSATVAVPYTSGTNATGSVIKNSNFTTPVWNQNLTSANFAGNTLGAMSATTGTSAYTITCTFTVATNFQFNPTTIGFDNRGSGTGPNALTVTISGTGGSTSKTFTPSRTAAFTTVAATNFLSTTENLTGAITLTFAFTGGSSGSTERFDNVKLGGNVTASSSAPTLTTPTATTITDASATLGATIATSAGSNVTANGVYLGTSATPRSGGNGGTSLSISSFPNTYTYGVTGLSAQTAYFYAGYATNTTNTGYSSDGTFRTLSSPPSVQSSNVTATAASASQINLSINAATFPSTGATQGGYVVIYSTGTPTLSSANGVTPAAGVGSIFGTTATNLPGTQPSTSVPVTGLSTATTYNFLVVPYTWDGTNATTYNYLTSSAPTKSGTTNANPPTLTTPTVTTITNNSATLGATVTADGGAALTARGTVYKTSSPVAITDNALAEGGTTVAAYSHSRTGLSPETQYYYAGYASNSSASGLSSENNFRTLSNPPTAQAGLSASATSTTQIDLTISAATFPGTGATQGGYIVIYSTGTPSLSSANGSAPVAGVGSIFTTSATVLPSAPSTTVNVTGLSTSTLYNFLIIPYTWDGTNATTYNYLTGSAPTAFATTLTASSPTISSSGTLSAVNTTYGTASVSPTTFSLSGAAMNAGITVTPPAGFEVCLASNFSSTIGTSGSPLTVGAAGTIPSTPVYVRLAATSSVASSPYSGDIVLSSSGATPVNVATVSSSVSTVALTITGLTGVNKPYDGLTTATASGTADYAGLVNSETFTVTGTPSFAYGTATVGNTKTITVTGYTAPSTNYTVTQPALTADITAVALTINGLTGVSRVYDATTTATTTGTAAYVGLVNSESFTVTGTPVINFADANVGTGKTITITGYTAPSANYTVSQPTGLTADITKASQTITFGALAAKTTADAAFALTATASSLLSVTYVSSNLSVATISGVTVTIVGAGTTTITASQAGNGNYSAASDVDQTLTVTNAPVVLAGWQFGSPASTGSEATYNATTNNSNLSTVTLSRGAGIAATGLARGFSSTTWEIGATKANAITNNEYFQFALNANTGFNFSLSTLDATLRRTLTAPNTYIWKYSLDGTNFIEIGSDISFSSVVDGVAQSQINLSGISALQNAKSITFRLYAWGGITNTTGTFAFARYGAGITTNCLAIGGNSFADITPPTLNADASANTVDNNIDVTFTDDATWRSKITAVKVGATALTVTTDYVISAGNIQLKPSGANVLLTTSGSKALTIVATGYADATLSQTINAGVPTANSTATINAILAPSATRTVTCTAKDQYNNLVSGYTFKYDATVISADVTTTESYTLDGSAITVTANNNDLTTTTDGSGVATFTAILPAIFDLSDGLSLQVQLSNGSTDVGSAFAYHELPGQTITFGALSAVTYGDAAFIVSATGGLSGNPVTFTSSDPTVATCTGTNGTTITILKQGTTTISANQAGNISYNAAAQVDQTLTVNTKGLTIIGLTGVSRAYNGLTTATTSGTAVYSGLAYSDAFSVTGTPSFNFNDANVGSGKTITVTGYTAPSANYTLTQPTLTADITQASQTISFGSLPNRVTGGSTFTLTLNASSDLPISYSSSDLNVATVSGNTVTIVGVGTTTITASQVGNSNYSAATDVPQTQTILPIPLAGWDFFGQSSPATFAATTFSSNLVSTSGASNITRGAGAATNGTANSFSTTGFQDNGISTGNTDYFQITLTPSSGYQTSLSTINANFDGTNTFYAGAGVTSQYAYSLDGTNFTLIGSPIQSATLQPAQIDLSGISALQNVGGNTITIRYYASGQTTTGGWRFYSPSAGVNGLAIGGSVSAIPTNNWTGGTGNWNNTSNWSLSAIPLTTDNITISSGSPIMDVSHTLAAGRTLTISGTGSLTINPSISLTIAGIADFGSKSVTLKSTSSGTGSIGQITGTLSNATNVTVERYIPANGRRYRFLASPVVGGTTLEWRDNGGSTSGRGIQITGTGTVDASTSNAPSAFSYNETNTTGTINDAAKWLAIDGSTTLTNGVGYRVFVRGDRSIDLTTVNSTNNATTIWVNGTYPTSPISLPVTYTASGGNGWNLVGNPFPCSIDWDASSGWSKTNIIDQIAVYRPSTNTYSYYTTTGNVILNNGSNIIGSGQAFWVKATASPTLTCSEAIKVTSAPPTVLLKSAPSNQLRLKLTQDSSNIDETIIAFGEKFSEDFIETEDVNKLVNATVNISSVVGVEKYAAINFTSNNYAEKTIPLSVWGSINGKYKLELTQVEGFDAGISLSLRDKFLNTITTINESKTINIDLNDNSKGDNRFELIFKNNGTSIEFISNTTLSVYPNPATDVLNISLSNGTTIETVNIYNVSGKLVNNTKLNGNQIDISQLNNGVYMVEVITANGSFKTKFVK